MRLGNIQTSFLLDSTFIIAGFDGVSNIYIGFHAIKTHSSSSQLLLFLFLPVAFFILVISINIIGQRV